MCLSGICINILKCELLKVSCHTIIEDVLLEKKYDIVSVSHGCSVVQNKSEICYEISSLSLLNYSMSGDGGTHKVVNVIMTLSRLVNMT